MSRWEGEVLHSDHEDLQRAVYVMGRCVVLPAVLTRLWMSASSPPAAETEACRVRGELSWRPCLALQQRVLQKYCGENPVGANPGARWKSPSSLIGLVAVCSQVVCAALCLFAPFCLCPFSADPPGPSPERRLEPALLVPCRGTRLLAAVTLVMFLSLVQSHLLEAASCCMVRKEEANSCRCRRQGSLEIQGRGACVPRVGAHFVPMLRSLLVGLHAAGRL